MSLLLSLLSSFLFYNHLQLAQGTNLTTSNDGAILVDLDGSMVIQASQLEFRLGNASTSFQSMQNEIASLKSQLNASLSCQSQSPPGRYNVATQTCDMVITTCTSASCSGNFQCQPSDSGYSCVCPAGFYRPSDTGCITCPEALTTHDIDSTSCDIPIEWSLASMLQGFTTLTEHYPDTHYDIGVRYQTAEIQQVHWHYPRSGATSIIAHPFIPQGQQRTDLKFATTVFHQGLTRRGGTTYEWLQTTYQTDIAGNPTGTTSSIDRDFPLFVRPRKNPFRKVGLLKDWLTLRNQYPDTRYHYGFKVRGAIQLAHVSSWNFGLRITCSPFHTKGFEDDDLGYVTSVFTSNLTGDLTAGWNHNWYQVPDTYLPGLGAADRFDVYVMKMAHPWQVDVELRLLGNLPDLRARYNPLEYEFGIKYNFHVRLLFQSVWNASSSRVTNYPFYFMGDFANRLRLGTSVFSRGAIGDKDDTSYWQYYYELKTSDGGSDQYTFGNANESDIGVHYRRRESPWVAVGGIDALDSVGLERRQFGMRQSGKPLQLRLLDVAQYSMAADSDVGFVVQNGVKSSGTRVATYPPLPLGSNSSELEFGVPVHTYNVPNDQTNQWHRAYLMYPGNRTFSPWTSTLGNVTVYVRKQTFDELHYTCLV
eukprot:m.200529 g.200529  ORF g.200529 m.200529 type:complete len:647 (-) comp17054_c0_seq16:1311-3251(-)